MPDGFHVRLSRSKGYQFENGWIEQTTWMKKFSGGYEVCVWVGYVVIEWRGQGRLLIGFVCLLSHVTRDVLHVTHHIILFSKT